MFSVALVGGLHSDARRAAVDRRTVADTWARRLEYAPVLAVVDSPGADEEDRALLDQLHPAARRISAEGGKPEYAAVEGRNLEALDLDRDGSRIAYSSAGWGSEETRALDNLQSIWEKTQ